MSKKCYFCKKLVYMKKLYLLIIISSLVLTGCTKKVESVTISPEEIELNADNHETYQLKAVVDPKSATKQLTWTSSNTFVATVNDNGIVQSKDIGECTITVQAGDKSANCLVIVYDATTTLQSITFTDASKTISVGQSEKLTYSLKPSFLHPKLTWASSDNNIVKVSENGTITALAEGTATITATHKDITGTCKITVKSTTISLNKTKDTLAVEDKMQLTATTSPSISSSFIKWTSSNTAVAKVDSTGKVTAIAKGDVVISAKVGQSETKCNIHVASAVISLPDKLSYYECRNKQISYTIRPASADNSVVWTSSSDSLIVGKNGNMTIKHCTSNGLITAVVTATYKEIVQKCTVSIRPASVNISPSEINMLKNTSKKITYTTTPSNDSALVTWSSSNTSVATVSSKGVVTTGNVTSGTAVITARLHDKRTATCNVNIVSALITLNKTSIGPMLTGTKDTLKATVNPSSAASSITWSSSNTSIATVSNNGIVTAKSAGTAVITATIGNSSAQCTVTVDSRNVWICDGYKIYKNNELYLTLSSNAEKMVRYNGYCYTIRREHISSYGNTIAVYRNNTRMDTLDESNGGVSSLAISIADVYVYSGKMYIAAYLNYSDSNACVYEFNFTTNKLSRKYYRLPIYVSNTNYIDQGASVALISASSSGTIYTAWASHSYGSGKMTRYIKRFENRNQQYDWSYTENSSTCTYALLCKAYNTYGDGTDFFMQKGSSKDSWSVGNTRVVDGTTPVYNAAYDNSGNLYAIRSNGSVTKSTTSGTTTILPSGTVGYFAKIATYNSDYYIYDAGKIYKNGSIYAYYSVFTYSGYDAKSFIVE